MSGFPTHADCSATGSFRAPQTLSGDKSSEDTLHDSTTFMRSHRFSQRIDGSPVASKEGPTPRGGCHDNLSSAFGYQVTRTILERLDQAPHVKIRG